MIVECALCHVDIKGYSLKEDENQFCCIGCQTVFNILRAKNELNAFEEHPIFIQALRSGFISNPALLNELQKKKVTCFDEKERLFIEIGEMWCPSCAEIIRLLLLKEKGVITCLVDYATDLASVEFSPRHLSKERIIKIIEQLGYKPRGLDDKGRGAVGRALYIRFIIAAFCSLNLMMLAYPLYATYFNYDGEGYGHLLAWLSFAASLPVILYSAWPIWRRFLVSVGVGLFGMETLVTIGVGAALAVSLHELLSGGTKVYFDSMSVIIVFVLLGKIIESRAKFSAKDSLLRLTRSTPRRGRKRFAEGDLRFVLLKEIAKGDVLVVYPGEKIALDGLLIEGEGSCDESLMTGEALPVMKQKGSLVLAGTVLIQGYLSYKVMGTLEETALQRIIQIVEHDIGNKSVYIRAADNIVRWFVPAVVAIAVLTAIFYLLFPSSSDLMPHQTALLRALAVLLISCPCAIGIAAPTAESHVMTGLAAMGAIVRNRGCLKYLGNETMIVFDKTGTITEGRFTVISGLENVEDNDKAALFNLASKSIHPIACALAAELSGAPCLPVSEMQENVGLGLSGYIDGESYLLGSKRFLRQKGIEISEGKTVFESDIVMSGVYFAKGNKCLSELILGDKIRLEALKVVEMMRPSKAFLLSGDSEAAVASVAKACGFEKWRSECSPLEKREIIEKFRGEGEIICMVGDGINDTPALTASQVGVSMASASDMSIQVSDLLLTTENLIVLRKIREVAKKGQKIIWQNLFWAFFYNVIGIFLAAFGILSPIFAAIAMSLSSLTVLFNARRITN